jgi:exonuclease III
MAEYIAKGDNRFHNLLVATKIDVICLQETHSTKDDLIRWQNEWTNCGDGNGFFDCGTNDSRGVGILLSKKLKENVEFFYQDNSGRILRSTLKINDSTFYISNINAPNNGRERKSFFNAINDPLFEYTDDSYKNYSLILGDFNCAIKKNLDRNHPQQLSDISVREFQNMLHRNDLFDMWRKLNPETIYIFIFIQPNTMVQRKITT